MMLCVCLTDFKVNVSDFAVAPDMWHCVGKMLDEFTRSSI